jgi:hypothetical protein
MSAPALRREESLGLALAVAGHAALFAWMIWQEPPPPPPLPERMTVTISDEVGLTSAAPAPQVEAAPDKGPELGEAPPPPAPEPVAVAKPAPVPPRPVPAPAKVAAKPVVPPVKPAAKQAQIGPKAPPKPGKAGASVFDNAFSKGFAGAKPNGKAAGVPAVATGQQRSSWSSQIGGKVASRLRGCGVTGLDIASLFIDVRFTLAVDGSIQSIDDIGQVQGTTPANQAQAAPFKACAIRAIKLSAPFTGLPPEFYNDWKVRKMRLRLREQNL